MNQQTGEDTENINIILSTDHMAIAKLVSILNLLLL